MAKKQTRKILSIMNSIEQFKIDSLEELEQAYEMFNKDNWLIDINQLKLIYTYSNKKFVTKVDNRVFLNKRAYYCKLIPSPLKNKSMFNQELIQKLREGEIAVINDGSLEQLRAVLKEAFPEDGAFIGGGNTFYYKHGKSYNWWPQKSKPNMLSFSVKDFFNYITLDLKSNKVEKYVLREPNHIFEDELSPDHPNVDYLTKAGVFDSLYKSVYKKDKPKLPEINGYKGEVLDKLGDKVIKYGCAFLSIDWFKETKNRKISYLPLSSVVVIDAEEMQQIRKYLKYYDHI